MNGIDKIFEIKYSPYRGQKDGSKAIRKGTLKAIPDHMHTMCRFHKSRAMDKKYINKTLFPNDKITNVKKEWKSHFLPKN